MTQEIKKAYGTFYGEIQKNMPLVSPTLVIESFKSDEYGKKTCVQVMYKGSIEKKLKELVQKIPDKTILGVSRTDGNGLAIDIPFTIEALEELSKDKDVVYIIPLTSKRAFQKS